MSLKNSETPNKSLEDEIALRTPDWIRSKGLPEFAIKDEEGVERRYFKNTNGAWYIRTSGFDDHYNPIDLSVKINQKLVEKLDDMSQKLETSNGQDN